MSDANEDDGVATTEAGASTSETPVKVPSKKDFITIENAIEKVGMGRFQRRILWAAGLCFAADSMEILLLSFLAVVLQAQWSLSREQTATITSSVFLGAMIGTLILGPLGDVIGRRPVFSLTSGIIALFGLLTAAAANLPTVVAMRFLTGFGVGGLTVPFDTLSEFVPTSHRGFHLVILSVFWCFGTIVTPIFAYITLGNGEQGVDTNAWRVFVIICALPCLISTIVGLCFVPESPRWLLTRGRREEALNILRRAATLNGKNPDEILPAGISLIDEEEHSTNCCHLLSPEWRKTTIFMWITWAGFAFVYYGCIQVTTLVFSSTGENMADLKETYTFDYGAIMASGFSEMAGTIVIIFTVERVGRIPTQVVAYLVGGFMTLALSMLASKNSPRPALIATAFLSRMAYSCATSMTWISTAEILTTDIRTTGHSITNAIARLGGASSPFLVNYGSTYPTMGGVLLAVSIVTACAAGMLPETKGLALGNVVHHEEPHLEDIKTSEII